MKSLWKTALLGMALLMAAGSSQASFFATELVDWSASLNSSGWYNNPENLLGKPTTMIAAWGGGTSHVSIVEPPYGQNTLTTFNLGDWAVVKFPEPVWDNPSNPYGLDFIVYGNAFFAGSGGFVSDTTDHRTFDITGGLFAEPTKISVSPDGIDWYTYDGGHYADSYYPTNPWVWDPDLWDATGNGWTDVENDYFKPVNPALTAADFAGTSYNAMLLYEGSAGGTGFDLAESGFEWIQYVKVEGLSGFAGGEIDAFAAVAPVPVPGALWLLGSGLLGLAGLRGRMRKVGIV